ncbi:MAG: hypothetical protein COB77_01555 [Gammaproteobacteria bacterium]|nr:MAG: hypothetical protein COB77_01555 [Gammaproteobacteria bacterium]
MPKKRSIANVEAAERRKRWRDRRLDDDRRNPERLKLVTYDCRSGEPRRAADVAGELSEGEIWWKSTMPQHE